MLIHLLNDIQCLSSKTKHHLI